MPGTAYLEIDGDVAFLVIDNPPVNAGSGSVRTALLSLIEQVDADPSIKAAVLIGAGQTFMVGSDIKEFDLPLTPPQLPQVIGAIERSPKPFVAAISGAALGGGYELALGCDARIATPEAANGLPETQLGILPGAGGTQKLPRLVGLAKAVELIAGGKRIGAAEALALGMIDQLAGSDLRAEAAMSMSPSCCKSAARLKTGMVIGVRMQQGRATREAEDMPFKRRRKVPAWPAMPCAHPRWD